MPANKDDVIDSFNGRYRFLSNFHPVKVIYDNIEYSSVEHAYQAAKTLNPSMRRKIRETEAPKKAKELGRKAELRSDWERIKLSIMEELLKQKFSNPDLKRALLNTGEKTLIEGNWWGDVFYGVCNGKGENHLGKLLMKIRTELRG